MASRLATSRALGAAVAAVLLLSCCPHMADAAFTSPMVLAPIPEMAANPQPRLELREFMSDTYRAVIFIRSLTNLQTRNWARLDSYSALAAIHGTPIPYDGVLDGLGNGYCSHNEQFFGTWHKPYLSLIEQALYEEANRLAAQYTTPDRDLYVTAARNMRLPYVDTAAAGGQVPRVLLQTTYRVTLPNGFTGRVRNPLSTWNIPFATRTQYGIADNFRAITRDPSWTPAQNPVFSNIEGIRRDTLSMFRATTYACFTNNRFPCTNTGSLEGLHNGVHVTVGGPNGHMRFVSYAAFDPFFFLHHCNVDRQQAIWEGINPATPLSGIEDRDAFPFRSATSGSGWWRTRDLMNVYTGRTSRDWGYYYPEFTNPAVTPDELRQKVDELYNDNRGQPIIVASFINANQASADGSAEISLAATSSPVPAPVNAATRRSKPLSKGPRRMRRVVVRAGKITLVKASSRKGTFSVSRVNLDITDALAKLKAANPDGLTSVSITATVTPNNGTTTTPTVVNLGTPIITTLINGQPVATNAPHPPRATARYKKRPVSADIKLFAGVKNVIAVVKKKP